MSRGHLARISQCRSAVAWRLLAPGLTVVLAAVAAGCGAGEAPARRDAGATLPGDAGATLPGDAGVADAGEWDAGVDDAAGGASDAAPDLDADLGDAGVATDAARPDGGGSDAARADATMPPGTWRSALFPANWLPRHAGGAADAQGRYLPDFSYGGYHRGEQHPPAGRGTVVATISAALGNGTTDATAAIQAALNGACATGGVVRLPAGTYRVTLPSATAPEAIRIGCSRVVLRGDGPAQTRIVFDDARRARGKAVLAVRGGGTVWDGAGTTSYALAQDVARPTRTLTLAATPGLTAGQWVVVRNDVTDAFRAEHRMDPATSGLSGLWPSDFRGLFYPRRVVRVAGTTLEIDSPVHYALRTRDRARVYAISGQIEESGVESLAIGMVQNTTTPGRTEPGSDDDYSVAGTTGYEVHNSRALFFVQAHDCWAHDVDTFAPAANTTGVHVLSNGYQVDPSAWRITLERCDAGAPQYRGGGGNGYAYQQLGHDTLIVDSSTRGARHGTLLATAASGVVWLRTRSTAQRMADDTHRLLSHADLWDNATLDRAWLQSVNRGDTSAGAGFTGTQIVFWNPYVVANATIARGCAVESAQWGYGYLIGSRAAAGATARLCPTSFSNGTWAALDQGAPTDFVEGEGQGATLYPGSLYEAQRALRCAREGVRCEP